MPGLELWSNAIDWPHREAFINAKRHLWRVGDKVAGFAQQYDKLTRVMVKDAGHIAPRKYATLKPHNLTHVSQ